MKPRQPEDVCVNKVDPFKVPNPAVANMSSRRTESSRFLEDERRDHRFLLLTSSFSL
jgi:hypothetical protein